MTCDVVIMGASGRMGNTLVQMVNRDEELNLAGVVEREGREDALKQFDCVATTELFAALPQVPGAVIVDFTSPDATMTTVKAASKRGNPVVIGTTGLTPEQIEELHEYAKVVPLFWAPNMSVGVNVLLKVLPQLVEMLGPDYDIEMSEIHHNKKMDAPSGTAIKLAECLAEARDWKLDDVKNYCRDGIIGPRPKEEIGVQTLRGGDVVGDHTMYFFGPGERIEVTHRAHSRDTFAQGALRAAKWLKEQKPGKLYMMADIF
ncbi:MAG: 4-hydroxy-tetrahydrodipicolinate reductase [Desulfovibrio sp.]